MIHKNKQEHFTVEDISSKHTYHCLVKLDEHGVGHCTEDCPTHDGKRCGILGCRPGYGVCEPWARLMSVAEQQHRTRAEDLENKVKELEDEIEEMHYHRVRTWKP